MTSVIFHNPSCATSRNTLAIIRATRTEPIIFEYLISGWTKPLLLTLFAAANLTPRQALRIDKSPAAELGLTEHAISDDILIDAMIAHPILVNRPIVVTPKGVRLCRPSERVLEITEKPLVTDFQKEDGEIIVTQVVSQT